MSELPDYVLDLIAKIAKDEGFIDYKINLKPGSNHGDNFLGVMTSATITGIRNNNDEQLHLLCKLAPSNSMRRQEFQSVAVFQRETLMYNKILPLLAKFQKEKGLPLDYCFTAYPKCYVAIADEENDQFLVIMEDLRPQGFTMWPKNKVVAVNHASCVVEQLAKLHAISFAIKDQRPKLYEELKEVKDLFGNFFKSENLVHAMNMGFDRAIGALENKEHVKIAEEVKENGRQLFQDCLTDGACEPFGVIGHGDCWTNNILYRYAEGTKDPTDICLVDWQISRYGSPVLDLHYNLFTSTDHEFRHKNYHNLMKHYHKTLSEIVTRLGSDIDHLFSFDDFQGQLKKFGKFAFLIGPMMTHMMLADASDIPDLDELSENMVKTNGKVEIVNNLKEDAQREYNKRINDMFGDMIEYGYYWN